MTTSDRPAPPPAAERRIAYFSMEIGLEATIPTYSGGLGILAGDTVRSAADLRVPLVAVTLLHRQGYFYQRLDSSGWQTEEPTEWAVDDFMTELPARASLTLEGRTVHLRAWRYDVPGVSGFDVPVYFLDTDLPENDPNDRTLTHSLYGGDQRYRLCQEAVLGIGGVRILRALGHRRLERFHLNEGHASLLALELLDEICAANHRQDITLDDIDAVRKQCVFTTHTPVPAGHDQFPLDLVRRVLGDPPALRRPDIFCCDHTVNLTYLALNLSHYVNGVAKKHGEVSRHLFASYIIDSITNGVHAATWTSEPFQQLFDRYIPGWRSDSFSLRYALNIPKNEIWHARLAAKRKLLDYVNHETNAGLDLDVFTLGFARRATSYKRADLIFHDPERLKAIARNVGPCQLIFAGKAHPNDEPGKQLIQRIFQAAHALKPAVHVAYLNNYDIELGKLFTSGVDVWLNTPEPPLEASGTSGMKAAFNGVPSFSILDGWWLEGCIENVTGWAIGTPSAAAEFDPNRRRDQAQDADSLYSKLQDTILPMFYHDRDRFLNVMAHCIALNGSFFNTQRMMQQYVLKAYFT